MTWEKGKIFEWLVKMLMGGSLSVFLLSLGYGIYEAAAGNKKATQAANESVQIANKRAEAAEATGNARAASSSARIDKLNDKISEQADLIADLRFELGRLETACPKETQ